MTHQADCRPLGFVSPASWFGLFHSSPLIGARRCFTIGLAFWLVRAVHIFVSTICKRYELLDYQTYLLVWIPPWWVTITVIMLLNAALLMLCSNTSDTATHKCGKICPPTQNTHSRFSQLSSVWCVSRATFLVQTEPQLPKSQFALVVWHQLGVSWHLYECKPFFWIWLIAIKRWLQ